MPKSNDNESSIQQLKEEVQRFCEQRNWDEPHNPKDLAIGIITEASELLEHFRFLSIKEASNLLEQKDKREQLGEELADILCFLLRFAERYNFDLSDCLQDKLAKTAKKYPVPESNLGSV